MASKRKKRRQATRRAAQKMNAQATVTTDKVIEFHNYSVAAQKVEGGPIYVNVVREHDPHKLIPFVCRMHEVEKKEDFTFLEIHMMLSDGVAIVVNGGDWPRGVAIIRNTGYTVRGKDASHHIKAPPPKPRITAAPATATTTVTRSVVLLETSKKRKKYNIIAAGVSSHA